MVIELINNKYVPVKVYTDNGSHYITLAPRNTEGSRRSWQCEEVPPHAKNLQSNETIAIREIKEAVAVAPKKEEEKKKKKKK